VRNFRWLWWSNLFFFGSTWMLTLILGWLVYDASRSALLLGVFGVLRTAPLVIGPVAGVLADRVNRIALLMVLTGFAGAAITALAVAVAHGHRDVRLFLAAGLVVGLAHSPTQPARLALVYDFVARDRLHQANALNAIAVNMSQIVGPTVGGLLLSGVGGSRALWAAAALYAAAVVTLIPLRHAGRATAGTVALSLRQQFFEGIKLTTGVPMVVGLLLVTVFANLLLWPVYQSFMPAFAADRLHLGPQGLALLLTSVGAGGLVGSLIIARLDKRHPKGTVFTYGTVVCACAWALFAASTTPWLSLTLLFLGGVASAAFMTLQATLLLLAVPPAAHGRAFGLLQLSIGTQPLGTLGLGVLADHLGIAPAVAISSCALAAIVLVIAARYPSLSRHR
jgi:predicted MFS family arabinose efflux permease